MYSKPPQLVADNHSGSVFIREVAVINNFLAEMWVARNSHNH